MGDPDLTCGHGGPESTTRLCPHLAVRATARRDVRWVWVLSGDGLAGDLVCTGCADPLPLGEAGGEEVRGAQVTRPRLDQYVTDTSRVISDAGAGVAAVRASPVGVILPRSRVVLALPVDAQQALY